MNSYHAMIYHLRLDGLLVLVRQISRCTEKGLFKITVIDIFFILNSSVTKCSAMVIPGLISSQIYHEEILLIFFYSF